MNVESLTKNTKLILRMLQVSSCLFKTANHKVLSKGR